ncbi:MAG: hypothetical protein AAGC95_05770 [Pseudomonadota bacterium]
MHLKYVHLTIARNPGEDIPEDEYDQRYLITAPLTPEGHIDETLWRDHKDKCEARHITAGRADRIGKLTRRGGAWRLHYPGDAPSDDEMLFHLDTHKFLPGEYVTVSEPDGDVFTYRIARVEKGPRIA